jgi:predicted NUDIX family NTP pyrophosphohydrolase
LSAKQSAGILAWRSSRGVVEVFLVHPGGPFWAKKDARAWTIPKGEFQEDEEALAAARREFQEETGLKIEGEFIALRSIKQKGGKIVHAWAIRTDFDASLIRSNSFSMEWPPRSGRTQEFPEIDRGEWFDIQTAQTKILNGQLGLLEELAKVANL